MKTKKVKRNYKFTRKQLADALSALENVLDIDTYELSPYDVESELTRLRQELEDLASDMLAEK